jgi:hypothetical protein
MDVAGERLPAVDPSALTHIIDVPDWMPTPLNKLLHTHWATAARMKRQDFAFIWAHAHGIPSAEGKRSVTIQVTLRPKQRATDPDSLQKSVGDALVRCKLLKNDSHPWVEWLPITFERGVRAATRIVLKDI